MADLPQFLFATCQVGAERALKSEMARRHPGFRFAFSRPGFLTFKLPEEARLPSGFDPDCVFARSAGFSLGPVSGGGIGELAAAVWRVLGDRKVRRIHAWQRDRAAPGDHGYEPGMTAEATAAGEAIRLACPRPEMLAPQAADPSHPARPRETILDCILVEPDRWWVGFHRAGGFASRWPGGIAPPAAPPEAVSRAWLKMEEALQWSELPIPPGARVAELGSAPGGASQALLARGCLVLGIDPAEMHPTVLAHPNFTHLRRRSTQVRRREFRKIRWLVVDMNVAPSYALEAVEAIVTHPEIRIRGLLMTLKLAAWELADEVPGYLDRVRGWGYPVVRARQLLHNRQEICVAALRQAPPVSRRAVLKRPIPRG